jgi:hypothetical protein
MCNFCMPLMASYEWKKKSSEEGGPWVERPWCGPIGARYRNVLHVIWALIHQLRDSPLGNAYHILYIIIQFSKLHNLRSSPANLTRLEPIVRPRCSKRHLSRDGSRWSKMRNPFGCDSSRLARWVLFRSTYLINRPIWIFYGSPTKFWKSALLN